MTDRLNSRYSTSTFHTFLFILAFAIVSLIGNNHNRRIKIWNAATIFKEEHMILPFLDGDATNSTIQAREEKSFSACLLTMDDNHFLIEWLAYHYHALPLRRLVVAVDPDSKTSPSAVFQRWRRHGMDIEEWTDTDFMPRKLPPNVTRFQLHHGRQRTFYSKCMKHLHAENRTWTLFLDSDEYLVVNHRRKSSVTGNVPSTSEPASVLSLLNDELPWNSAINQSPCIMIPRLRYGTVESPHQHGVPPGFNASSFQTMRWRKHAAFNDFPSNKLSKAIFDVSQVSPSEMVVKDPHRLTWKYCPKDRLQTRIEDSTFVVHHYLGTWEQYTFRNDVRKGGNRSSKSFDKYKDLNVGDDDSIRPWLEGFVDAQGSDSATKLLNGVGDVHRAAKQVD